MDQASLRRKSIWRTQAWCGGHYPCLQDVDKVMRIIRMVPMMVTRVLEIQATMTVATSITSDVFRCFYPGRHPETWRKHRKRMKTIDKQLDILKPPQFTH